MAENNARRAAEWRPLISIIVPSFNQGRYIRETIDSILQQDYRPIEILVMDGKSTDETLRVLESFEARPELRWWSEPDRGVVDAVNKGIRLTRGEVVAIQSSDDAYLPRAFHRVVKEFASDSDTALIYGDVEFIDAESNPSGRTSLRPFDLREYVGKLTFIPQPAAFFRADAMREAGEWREDISYAADAEFFLRIASRFRVRKIDDVLARYRYHEAQRDKESTCVPLDWATAIDPWRRHHNPRLRRSARGGIWRTYHHYTPEARWVLRTWYAYRMICADPASITRSNIRLQELVPFGVPIRRLLSRVKRGLGFEPRT